MQHLLQAPILGGVNSKSLVYSSFNLDKELTKVDPVEALNSGKITKDDIGKTVYLSNSKITCQEWRIADVDHDGMIGSVDLVSKYLLDKEIAKWSYWTPYEEKNNQTLSESPYNLYFNYVDEGFSTEVYSYMRYMDIQWHDNKYESSTDSYRKRIKLPSATELGFAKCEKIYVTDHYGYFRYWSDGNIYPLFGSELVESKNSLANIKTTSNAETVYCTRSLCWLVDTAVTTPHPVIVNKGTRYALSNFNYSYQIPAVIRFGGSELDRDLAGLDPVKGLTSGKITKDYIGKSVYIKHDDIMYNEWIIIDINHDGTSGTVDLCPKHAISGYNYFTTYHPADTSYKSSKIRADLNSTFYNKFSDAIKSAMVPIQITSDGYTTNDYVALPSCMELAGTVSIYPEGSENSTQYPYFDNSSTMKCHQAYKNNKDVDNTYDDKSVKISYAMYDFYTRGCHNGSNIIMDRDSCSDAYGYYPYYINTYDTNNNTSSSVLPIIRFGKK